MRKIYALTFLLGLFQQLQAQQLHFMSTFIQHNSMYNPGAAGFTENGVAGMAYRSMWSAFPGNPKTFMVYADTKWEKKSSGVAGYLYRDVTGPTSRTGLQLAYSYHVKTGEHSKLGLGLEVRALQYSLDRSKLNDALGSDPVLTNGNDRIKGDAGAGVYFSNGKLSLGAAVSQIIQSQLSFGTGQNVTEQGRLYRHYNFTANYMFNAGDDVLVIPNFLMRVIENSPSEYEFGVKVDYQSKLWWALNYRIKQFWSLQAGFKLMDRVGVSYVYDYYNAPFSDYNTGNNAHEVGLRFDLKKSDQ